MENNSDNPDSPRRASRSSLVERAAQKIVADRAPANPRTAPRPAPPPPPVEPEAHDELATFDGSPAAAPPSSPVEPVTNGVHDPVVEEALEVAQVAPDAELLERPKPSSSAPRRQSRIANIEFEALMARDILTPETKRNRTVEEFRLIKRMVLSRRWDQNEAPGNTIVVTSALPSEGKTTTAINLAMSIAAEEDLRVLLVDADFIKPDALRQLGVSADKGLIDVIQDPKTDLSDVMLRTNIEKLSLIPAGQLHDRCTELLASARMDEIITELASRYEDRILIFDSPPVLATTESVVLASHMGQVIFVVQAGRTKRESVDSALELLGDRPNMGLVLNRSAARLGNTEFGSYYSAYYYGYGEKRD